MKSGAYILLSLALLFSSCKKEEKLHTVLYKVTVIGGNPSYSVSFSGSNNTSVSQGPFTSGSWISPQITDKVNKDEASLTLIGHGGGSYKMYIYVDGALAQEGRMDDPYGPTTISITIYD